MLSVVRCRELLRGGGGSDAEIERLRDALYALANVAIDLHQEHRLPHALRLLPSEQRDAVGERAAIVEFEGGLRRDEAERRAVWGAVQRRNPTGTGNE